MRRSSRHGRRPARFRASNRNQPKSESKVMNSRLNKSSKNGEVSEWLPQASEAGDEESTQRVRRSHKPQHWKKVTNSRLNKSSKNGEVSEWLKEHAWKVCIRQRIEGSNPSLTAIFKEELQQCGFFCIWNSRNRLWEGENSRGFEPSAARQHRAAMAPKGGRASA